MFEKVQAILAEQLHIDKSKITMNSDIVSDLKADSMEIIGLLLTLEEEYNITIEDEDAAKIKKISDVVTYLEKHV